MKYLRKLKKFILTQFVFYFKIRPIIPKSIVYTYQEHKKKLKNTYVLSNDYFNQYMPVQYDKDNPSLQDRLCINHYRLWNFIVDQLLYFEHYSYPIFQLKEKYFSYFKQDTIRNNCFLCLLDKKKYSDKSTCYFCQNVWGNLFTDSCYTCLSSYYGILTRYDYLTKNQKALICFMIASLPINQIETQFYRNHLLADCSAKKIEEAWGSFNIKKLHGVYEPEPLYRDLFQEGK